MNQLGGLEDVQWNKRSMDNERNHCTDIVDSCERYLRIKKGSPPVREDFHFEIINYG